MNLNSSSWNLLERTLIDYRIQRKFRKPICGPKYSKSQPVCCQEAFSLCWPSLASPPPPGGSWHTGRHPTLSALFIALVDSPLSYSNSENHDQTLAPLFSSSLESEYRTSIFSSGLHHASAPKWQGQRKRNIQEPKLKLVVKIHPILIFPK